MSRGLVFILLCACLALELSAVAIGRTLIRGLAFQAKHRALPGSRRALDTSLGYANAESQSDSVDNVPKVDLAAWIGRVNHGVNQDLVSTDREAQLRVLSSYEAIMDKNRKRNGTMDDIQSIELLRSRKAGRRRRWQVSKINKIYPLVDPDDVLLGLAPPSADELVDLANSKDFVPRNPRLGPCKFLTPGIYVSCSPLPCTGRCCNVQCRPRLYRHVWQAQEYTQMQEISGEEGKTHCCQAVWHPRGGLERL